MTKKSILRQIVVGLIAAFVTTISAPAQSTAFTYQGKLTDNGAAQNVYQMQFALFDAPAGGAQIGGLIANPSVAVAQGVFTVQLDFGASVFTGADRFLQISVRRNASETYTILSPREKIASSPYSVRTLSAAQADISLDSNKLGGVLASEYVTTSTVGNSFIKNAATLQSANFNISGNGFVGGSLGVGTSTPTSKLQVFSGGYGFTQTDGAVTVGSFITGAGGGSGWFGTRSNHPLNFFTNDSLAQVTLLQSGNFGIGVTNPSTKLYVLSSTAGLSAIYGESSSGRGVWGKSTTSRGVYGESTSLDGVFGVSVSGNGVTGGSTGGSGVYGVTNAASLTAGGVYGVGTGSGSIGVIGESNIGNATGVFGVSTSPTGFGMYARNNFGGRAIFAEGNVAQSLSGSGVVKAMLYVQQDGVILRCYNSVTNVSTGNCGFTVTRVVATPHLSYRINFGFQVSDRFLAITPRGSFPVNIGVNFFFNPGFPNAVDVITFLPDVTYENSGTDANFMIIVY